MTIPESLISQKTHRIINTKHPTVGIFDEISLTNEQKEVGFVLEHMTSGRHLMAMQRLNLLPESEWVEGDSANIVMASFFHADWEKGGRFSDVNLGAWYGSLEQKTALSEAFYHNDRRLKHSKDSFPIRMQFREHIAKINCSLIDIRGNDHGLGLYDESDYTQSQKWANSVRWPDDGSKPANGIVFDSVRNSGGENICLFWPKLIQRPITQGALFTFSWDKDGNVWPTENKELKIV